MAYSVGVINNVNNVANVNPKIMVAAIPPNAISNNRGTIPRIVVVAAINTGRVLDTVASTTALLRFDVVYLSHPAVQSHF